MVCKNQIKHTPNIDRPLPTFSSIPQLDEHNTRLLFARLHRAYSKFYSSSSNERSTPDGGSLREEFCPFCAAFSTRSTRTPPSNDGWNAQNSNIHPPRKRERLMERYTGKEWMAVKQRACMLAPNNINNKQQNQINSSLQWFANAPSSSPWRSVLHPVLFVESRVEGKVFQQRIF